MEQRKAAFHLEQLESRLLLSASPLLPSSAAVAGFQLESPVAVQGLQAGEHVSIDSSASFSYNPAANLSGLFSASASEAGPVTAPVTGPARLLIHAGCPAGPKRRFRNHHRIVEHRLDGKSGSCSVAFQFAIEHNGSTHRDIERCSASACFGAANIELLCRARRKRPDTPAQHEQPERSGSSLTRGLTRLSRADRSARYPAST